MPDPPGAGVYTSNIAPRMRSASTFTTRTRIWIATAFLLIGATAVFAWMSFVPRTVTSINGEALGHLPVGVPPADLNLLIVTLDTTRADRIHAYGFDGVETPNLDRLPPQGGVFREGVRPV